MNKESNDEQGNRASDANAEFKKIKMTLNKLLNHDGAEKYFAQVRKIFCKKVKSFVHDVKFNAKGTLVK